MPEPFPVPELPPAWRLVEKAFSRALRVQPLTDRPDCLIAYSLYRHRGRAVPLQDGVEVRAGMLVAELHFRRESAVAMASLQDPLRAGMEMLKSADRDVPLLADALQTDAHLRDVQALHGLTLFHRGLHRYGFEVRPIEPAWRERWFTWWQKALMKRDQAPGATDTGAYGASREIWVSRERLIQTCTTRFRRPETPEAESRHRE